MLMLMLRMLMVMIMADGDGNGDGDDDYADGDDDGDDDDDDDGDDDRGGDLLVQRGWFPAICVQLNPVCLVPTTDVQAGQSLREIAV